MEDRYGTGQQTGPDYPGKNPSVGASKKSGMGGFDERETPSGYKRCSYKRSGTHHESEM